MGYIFTDCSHQCLAVHTLPMLLLCYNAEKFHPPLFFKQSMTPHSSTVQVGNGILTQPTVAVNREVSCSKNCCKAYKLKRENKKKLVKTLNKFTTYSENVKFERNIKANKRFE